MQPKEKKTTLVVNISVGLLSGRLLDRKIWKRRKIFIVETKRKGMVKIGVLLDGGGSESHCLMV